MAKKFFGIVSSDVQDKTITVKVTYRKTHRIYGKQYTVTRKFAVHDEDNIAHVGDMVEFVETHPMSRNKAWTLTRILESGHESIELKDELAAAEAKKEAA